MKYAFLALAAVALAGTLAACSGSSNSNPPAPGPTCSPPSGIQSALVYPAPGATAIPDQFGRVIIGSTAGLPSTWNVVILTPLNGSIGGNMFSTFTGTLPTPSATPGFANPVYQSSSFGNVAFPGQVLQVFLNNTASNCTPAGPIGSFTTQ